MNKDELIKTLKETANRLAYCIEQNKMNEDARSMIVGEIDNLNDKIRQAEQN